MSYVVSIGTYQPCRGSSTQRRVVDDDEDAVTTTARAAKQAFSTAGMTANDVNVAEVHDSFTGIEIIGYEDLGFAERFGAYKLLQGEETTIGGVLPVNTSGGIEGQGPPAAVCHVDGARMGLGHNLGGPAAVSAVTILEGLVA